MARQISSAFLFFFFASLSLQAQNIVFTESIEYDSANNRFLLSNDDNILARDSAGVFTVFGSESASHGMEVLGNTLFALEGNVIKGIDLTTEQKVMELTIPGATFLNGITNDTISKLYVTDFSKRTIYEIETADLDNPSFTLLVSNTQKTPNGIIYDGANNRLIYVTWGNNASVMAVDLSDSSVSTITATGLGNIDGIARDAAGQYYLSSWSPNRITIYDKDFSGMPMTLSTPSLNSPADIGLGKEINVLGIPMGSSAIFVELEQMPPNAVVETVEDGIRFGVHGNPVTDQSMIFLELEKSSQVEIEILDYQGKTIRQLFRGQQNAGTHLISLAGLDLPSGMYLIALRNYQTLSSSPSSTHLLQVRL